MFTNTSKYKNPETGSVNPSYNFSDIKYVRKQILEFCTAVNANKTEGEPRLDVYKIIRTASKRIAKHNGLDNKYRGDGTLR